MQRNGKPQRVDAQRQFPCGLSRCLSRKLREWRGGAEWRPPSARCLSRARACHRVLDAGSIGSDRDGSVREEATAGALAVLGADRYEGAVPAVCTVWIRTWLSKRLCCRRCLATRRTCRSTTTHQDMTCRGSQDTSLLSRSVKTRFQDTLLWFLPCGPTVDRLRR